MWKNIPRSRWHNPERFRGPFSSGRLIHWQSQMKLAVIACIAASHFCLPVSGQIQGLRDATVNGPAAGATAPDFSLLDQHGKRRTMESLMGPQGVVLVFFRSADW